MNQLTSYYLLPVFCCALLSSCGQKGALYIPNNIPNDISIDKTEKLQQIPRSTLHHMLSYAVAMPTNTSCSYGDSLTYTATLSNCQTIGSFTE